MTKEELLQIISSNITDNNNGDITAAKLRKVLNSMVEYTPEMENVSLDGYLYISTATPSTTPVTLTGDEKVFYIATREGDYTNFGLNVDMLSVLKSDNGQWVVESLNVPFSVDMSGIYKELSNKADKEDIPTKTSELSNDSAFVNRNEMASELLLKVDKVPGKQLSTEDFTTEFKQRLETIEDGEENVIENIELNGKLFSIEDKKATLTLDLINNVVYNKDTMSIDFFNNDTLVTSIDAKVFIKDGMVQKVVITDGNIVISFNTDSGAEDITIPISDIFNAENYWTREESDGRYLSKIFNQVSSETVDNIYMVVRAGDATSAPAVATSFPIARIPHFSSVPDSTVGKVIVSAGNGRVQKLASSVGFTAPELVMLDSGQLKKSSKSLGSTSKPLFLANGVFKEATEVATKASVDSKVDKIEGKGLSTNDYTEEEKEKLRTIEENAQVNDLESIYVNDFPVEIKSDTKRVNLTIPSKYDNPIVSVTYAELKSLRNSKNLIPGTMYRIVDFIVSANEKGSLNCNQSEINGISTLGNKFTILVTAKDDHTLFSSAQILSCDNENFDRDDWGADYSLDNDISIFPEESVFSGRDYKVDTGFSVFVFPFYSAWRNSLLQQLILKNDFLGEIPEEINMLSFKTYYQKDPPFYNPNQNMDINDNILRVYLKNTSLESLEDFTAVSEEDLCFEDTFYMENGYNGIASITLSKPFKYEGGNILLTTVGIDNYHIGSMVTTAHLHTDGIHRMGHSYFDTPDYVFDPYILPFDTIDGGGGWPFETPHNTGGYAVPLLFTNNNQATGHLTLTPKKNVDNIENITVNGVVQPVTNNSVEINVPQKISELNNDSNFNKIVFTTDIPENIEPDAVYLVEVTND